MIHTSSKISNYPNAQLDKQLTGTGKTREILGNMDSIIELNSKGRPENTEELKQRIRDFFQICEKRDIKPGIETLCLALSVNRSTLWRWCREEGADKEFADVCRNAKQTIIAMTEQAGMRGLNIALYAFTMKNIAGYRDSIDIVQDEAEDTRRALSISDLPSLEKLANKAKDDNSLENLGESGIGKKKKSPVPLENLDYKYL